MTTPSDDNRKEMSDMPFYAFCIDVGGWRNIGWADSEECSGDYSRLAEMMAKIGVRMEKGQCVALGFEAPVWTPVASRIEELTATRGGFEAYVNRAWSTSAGACVLAANLALMPWCFRRIAEQYPNLRATVRLDRFSEARPLLIWEAFVSGAGKGKTHADDAKLACSEFCRRWPDLTSDIPRANDCINHAVSAALASGISIESDELKHPAMVIGVRGAAAPL